MARERQGGRGLLWTIILVLFLALVWLGYWYAARYAAERAIARANAGPIAGREIACTAPDVGGFLVEVNVRCDRATYAERGGAVTAAIGGIAANAPLYWPGYVEATLDAPFVANVPDRGVALTANWSLATTSASAGFGGLSGASAEFVALSAENAGTMALPIRTAAAERAGAWLESAGGGSYTLRASAQKLALARPDGTAFPPIDISARVLAADVGNLGTDPAQAFLDWLRRSPKATLERFRLAIGDVLLTANGTLSLDASGKLNGSILMRFNSIEALGNLLETLKPGTRDKYQLALQGLKAMSVSTQTEDGPMRQTTVTLTEGVPWLAVIPLPVGPIPPLKF
jgi:hypothetical protein